MEKAATLTKDISPMTQKILLVIGMTLALTIPLCQVKNQVEERQRYETVAQTEVARGWGGSLTVATPALKFAGTTIYPTEADTRIIVDSKEKKRGVFAVPVYVGKITSTVKFGSATAEGKASPTDHVLFPVSSSASIQSLTVTDVATGKKLKVRADESGFSVSTVDLPGSTVFSRELTFEMSVRGTGALNYNSYADHEEIEMAGNWRKPKFTESILPTTSSLGPKGFAASWSLNHVPAFEGQTTRAPREIGVDHLWVKSDYPKVEKSVKYGILFISLTFLLVFFIETWSGVRVHPLQYLLIGFSICVFYLLLLALSEVISFDLAYISATAAVSGLIAFYVQGFIRSPRFVAAILAEQLFLSGFFYMLLSLEERAFLVGTLGLFVALAMFMALTRKLDWYGSAFQSKAS